MEDFLGNYGIWILPGGGLFVAHWFGWDAAGDGKRVVVARMIHGGAG